MITDREKREIEAKLRTRINRLERKVKNWKSLENPRLKMVIKDAEADLVRLNNQLVRDFPKKVKV